MKRMLALLMATCVVVGLLAGCGGKPGSGTGSDSKLTKVKLAVVGPMSAGAVALGESLKIGAQVAVNEKKDALTKAGYDVEVIVKDDQGKGDVAAQVATQILSDNQIVAIVGTFNSGTALAMLPKIKDANLTMVSPANTNDTITEGNKYPSYARVVFRDGFQGAAAARYLAKDLKVKKLYMIHDKTPYGQGLAESVQKEAKAQGMTIEAFDGSTDTQTDFSAIVTTVLSKKPDAIFYGGLAQAGSNLIKQARDKGYQGIIMGGDGFDDPDLVKLGGSQAEKTYFTSVNVDFTTAEAKKFAESYKKVSGGKDAPSYGAYSYDSANVILNSLIEYGTKNKGKAPSREELAKAVRATKGHKGLGGEISFDAQGDNPTSKPYVFQVQGGKFVSSGMAK